MPVKIAIVGCGAITEFYYGPVLSEFERTREVEVCALLDPEPGRLVKLKERFGAAAAIRDLDEARKLDAELAIVASPPRFHAQQAMQLLERGIAVLCEKPMAATVVEAEEMVKAAKRANRLLAIGLFRRFFPTNQMIRCMVLEQPLGRLKSFKISEGGQFNWQAQSPSFFQKSNSQGGVLADVGVHVLDLLIWWFGFPEGVNYEDDAMGGLEANCRLDLVFRGGIAGAVRLSRDTALANWTILEFERGWLRCKAAATNQLEIGFHGVPGVLGGHITIPAQTGWSENGRQPALSYHQSFTKQLENVLRAFRQEEPVFVPGEQGLLSMRLIEQCYRQRKMMIMPWLTKTEVLSARMNMEEAP
jgi:predicted dehydrogenase